MKLIVKYRICLYLFLLAFSLYSCSESETPVSDTTDNQARLNFLIRTTPKEEKLTLGGDDSFPVSRFIYSIKPISAANIRNSFRNSLRKD